MNHDLTVRLRTAAILIVAVLTIGVFSLYWCFFQWVLFDVALLASLLAAYEYVRFSDHQCTLVARVAHVLFLSLPSFFVASGVSILGLCERVGVHAPVLELAVLGLLLSFLINALLSLRERELSLSEIAGRFCEQTVATIFLGFFSSFLVMLAAEPGAFLLLAWFISVVAVNDSAAYFAGRKFGRHAVAPIISPKKTIEGSLAGLGAGTLVGAVSGPLLLPAGTFMWAAVLGALVVVSAQMGDFIKSMLKRLHHVKDSGTILPGHGGVLDRIDGLIGAAPIFYLLRDWFLG